MRLDINLLPRKGAREIFSERWLRRVKRGSFALLGVYGLVLLVIFGAGLFVGQLTRGVEGELKNTETSLAQYAEVERQHLLVKKKLSAAQKILSLQRPWGELVGDLGLTEEGATVREVTIKPEGTLRVVVETVSLRGLVEAFRELTALEEANAFVTAVTVETVEKTSKGYYSFTLLFTT